MWVELKRDIWRTRRGKSGLIGDIACLVANRGLQAMLHYRIANSCQKRHIPLFPFLLTRRIQTKYGIDISPASTLGGGIVIFHGVGLVIGNEVVMYGDTDLYHGVTLGVRGAEWVNEHHQDGHPVVGKNVVIGAGAKILGSVSIGDNCVIGANAVVTKSIPDNSVAVGIPARVIRSRPPVGVNMERLENLSVP
jgi:serine O-acetyltransferase